jgi:hypothetical protein
MLATAALLAFLAGLDPAWAVLKSTSLVVTDQGRVIPGATITLSRPHPRTARAPIPQQSTQTSQSGPTYQPPPAAPQPQNWVVARSDQTGRTVLQFDDREAPPGTLVDVTLYYPNGGVRELFDVPIETILAGGQLEITATAVPLTGSNAPPPGGYGPPPEQTPPPGGILPGFLPNIGIGIGAGGHGVGDRGRNP